MKSESLHTKNQIKFNKIWDKLEEVGKCDGRGGMEYKRVYSEWLDKERPPDIESFIIERANTLEPLK